MLNLKLRRIQKLEIGKDQSGFTLIETLIGTTLLVIVGAAVLAGVFTAFKASATSDKLSTALALAESQLEYIQTQEYICTTNGNAAYKRIDDVSRGAAVQPLPNNFSVSSIYLAGGVETEWSSASTDPPIVYAVSIDEDGNVVLADQGLQKITLIVYQTNNPNPVTVVGYKVKPDNTACP